MIKRQRRWRMHCRRNRRCHRRRVVVAVVAIVFVAVFVAVGVTVQRRRSVAGVAVQIVDEYFLCHGDQQQMLRGERQNLLDGVVLLAHRLRQRQLPGGLCRDDGARMPSPQIVMAR